MSLEKALELNTAAVSRLADLMERFKPNAATSETAAPVETPKAEKPAPKAKVIDKRPKKITPKAEEPKAEEPKAAEPKAEDTAKEE